MLPASKANRGKGAEDAVKASLAKLSEQGHTTFLRLPDARAGSFQKALCDFVLLHKGLLHLLEVKEVAHDCRLPHGNFDSGQVAKMRRWKLAGAEAFVLVYHSTTQRWRFADVDFFVDRTGGSWDLRKLPEYALVDILKERVGDF